MKLLIFSMYAVGMDEKLFTYCVKVNCILPKLKPSTNVIDFEDTDVLVSVSKSVEIINSSPINIPFAASVVKWGFKKIKNIFGLHATKISFLERWRW